MAVVSNPIRYESRFKLFRKFKKEMEHAGAQMIIVELAYGRRPFEITEPCNPHHLQLRSRSEIWHKENMINLGVRRLTEVAPDWKYMAWIDGDISFVPSHYYDHRQNWMTETVHKLQHHSVVQLFQTAIDLGPNGEAFAKHEGFAWAYVNGRFNENAYKYTTFHPGFAWAIRREAFIHVGGLIETSILGASDRHMAYGILGIMKKSVEKGLDPSYSIPLLQWQDRAERYIQRDLGYLDGTILHHWHGKKKDRRYHDRWKILVRNQFNPFTDLRRNVQGLLELVVMEPRQIRLRDEIRAYLRSRNEDSLDLE